MGRIEQVLRESSREDLQDLKREAREETHQGRLTL